MTRGREYRIMNEACNAGRAREGEYKRQWGVLDSARGVPALDKACSANIR